MNNEDHVFDYMAAAEETGQRLDLLVRQVPGHIKSAVATALADEWRKVTVFKELSETATKLNDAIGEVQESIVLLRRTVWMVAIAGMIVSAAILIIALVATNR